MQPRYLLHFLSEHEEYTPPPSLSRYLAKASGTQSPKRDTSYLPGPGGQEGWGSELHRTVIIGKIVFDRPVS